MENFQIGFVSFIAAYISSQSDNPKTKELLVRKMMKMKSVQKIILDSMSQLSALIYQEILSIENIRSSSHKIIPKNSKLLTLAEEVKNIMNNYVFIQGKVSDMREIINNFDNHIEVPQENKEMNELMTSAYSFLSGIPPIQQITNAEIEEISNDLWSKQVELETLLKIEVDKLKEFQNTIDNRYFYKYDFLKTKAGIKIKALENQQKLIEEKIKEDMNRFQMKYEDFFSSEVEKNLNEEKKIFKIFDPYSIKDLHEAISKIKELLSIKLIYEKKRIKDERLIKGLNSKLQIFIENYSELSGKYSKLESKFEELTKNHESLLAETSAFIPRTKDRFRIIAKQESIKLESTGKSDLIFSDFPIRKADNFIDSKITNSTIKGRNDSIRVFRTESRIQQLRKASPRKKIRSAAPASRTPMVQINYLQETQDNAINEFKQALIKIDEGFKNTNKALTENLEELVNFKLEAEILKESRELLERMANGDMKQKATFEIYNPKISDKQIEVIDEISVVEDIIKIDEKILVDKETQIISSFYSRATQTSSKLYFHIYAVWEANKNHIKATEKSAEEVEWIAIELLKQWFRDTKEKNTQTEKEVVAPIELKIAGNELIKGLMNRNKRVNSSKPEDTNTENSIIDKIIKIPLSEQELTEMKETEINDLIHATNEYKQEFKIHSQLKGYKRIELQNMYNIWDDIINRRISEGEQDKISIYLRGLLGTQLFENEKKGVIQMIQSSKMQDFNTFTSHQEKSKKILRKQRVEKNWKKLMRSLIGKNISYFTESLSTAESPKDKLFEAAIKIKFIKHRLKRTAPEPNYIVQDDDFFGFNKSEKWIVRSTTPTIMNTKSVKSRYLNTRHNKTSSRISKTKKIIQYRDIQISPSRN